MFAISPTDKEWFDFLKKSNLSSNINFWTPTPWNLKQLSKGDKFYFMLKSPIMKIGGFGIFQDYTNLTVINAWQKFEQRNGCSSLPELENRLKQYVKKDYNSNSYLIGCVILDKCEYWEKENFKDINDYDIDYSKYSQKAVYFDLKDPF